MNSITGRTDDQQVLLINREKSVGIIMGIKDIDNAWFIMISYLKATTMSFYGTKRVDLISYSQYSVDGQEGYIISYKLS